MNGVFNNPVETSDMSMNGEDILSNRGDKLDGIFEKIANNNEGTSDMDQTKKNIFIL